MLAAVEAFGFNPPDEPLAFESRLADDQGWTLGYALAVAEEYRRFLVLTQAAGQAVSPSPDVDEAWHLHLTRTAHYEAFCTAVFGRFLHHAPARAGEGAKHRDMYAATLEAYRAAFGAAAPAVTWPRPGQPLAHQAVTVPGWTVPWSLRRGNQLGLAVLLLAVVAGALLDRTGLLHPLQRIGPFAFLGGAAIVTLGLGWLGLRPGAPPARSTARDRLEPYEAAWFGGGAPRMAMTAIAALTERGLLLAPGKAADRGARPLIPVNRGVAPRCVHPAEIACLAAATDAGLRFTEACNALQPLAAETGQRLVAAGIAADTAALPRPRARALLGMLVLLVVEVARIVHALGTPHRVGLLVLLTLAGMGLAWTLARRPTRISARSERVLRPLRLAAGRHGQAPRAGQALAFGVALIGGTALAGDLRFAGLDQQLDATAAGWGLRQRKGAGPDDASGCSSSCGSSCGSSDAGSGGGSSCGSSCGSGCGGGGD
ncbi:MAG: TIGR04222 domain-containing membrane protein [Burkholderiales bacterium]|nr:TIGR04222 domain-containing membrane protein [Burkholderiales bacterium]